jgi:hypothetical protein
MHRNLYQILIYYKQPNITVWLNVTDNQTHKSIKKPYKCHEGTGGSRDIASLNLNLNRERTSSTNWILGWMGRVVGLDVLEKETYLLPLPTFKPQIFLPIPSHYTDYAIMAHTRHITADQIPQIWEPTTEFLYWRILQWWNVCQNWYLQYYDGTQKIIQTYTKHKNHHKRLQCKLKANYC